MTTKYIYTPDMGEISGFGGSYEAACQAMVIAGLEWMDSHSESNPKFKTYTNVYGIIIAETPEAKELESVMLAAAKDDCTGAMMHACVGHVLAAKRLGWEEYCSQLRDREKSESKTKSP